MAALALVGLDLVGPRLPRLRGLLVWALALTVVGAVAAAAVWWALRRRGRGDGGDGGWEPPPAPPPPPAQTPAEPVAA